MYKNNLELTEVPGNEWGAPELGQWGEEGGRWKTPWTQMLGVREALSSGALQGGAPRTHLPAFLLEQRQIVEEQPNRRLEAVSPRDWESASRDEGTGGAPAEGCHVRTWVLERLYLNFLRKWRAQIMPSLLSVLYPLPMGGCWVPSVTSLFG